MCLLPRIARIQAQRLLRLDGAQLAPVALEGELAGSQLRALASDSHGQIWLGASRGLAVRRGERFERVELPGPGGDADVTDLAPCRDGGLWVCHANFWQRRSSQGRWPGAAADLSAVKTRLSVLGEDRWGCLCLGRYPEGLVRISRDGVVSRIDRQEGLSGNTVVCCLADREGNEWLGLFDGGLVRLQPRRCGTLSGALETLTMPVYSVCEDHAGAIWVGTSLGGVYRFDSSNVTSYVGGDLPLTEVWSLFEDSHSNLWVGTSSVRRISV